MKQCILEGTGEGGVAMAFQEEPPECHTWCPQYGSPRLMATFTASHHCLSGGTLALVPPSLGTLMDCRHGGSVDSFYPHRCCSPGNLDEADTTQWPVVIL